MTNKNLKLKRSTGFTIIEVMIVLAIAGLIMLIVFLAVPALERSSRNTQRKNDASAVASAISNYINNNGGEVPDTLTYSNNSITVKCSNGGGNGTTCDKSDGNTETATVGIFTGAASDDSASAGDTESDVNTIEIVPGYTCNSTGTGLSTSTNSRSAAVLYSIETSNGKDSQCLEQ